MNRPFVFSADAHIAEPPDLYVQNLPKHLQHWAFSVEVEGKNFLLKIGDRVRLKVYRNFHDHKTGVLDSPDVRRMGGRDLNLRLKDMERDGVDAELCFPNLAMSAQCITDPEAALLTAQIYNNWAHDYLKGLEHKLIATAMIPVADLNAGLAEMERAIGMGFKAVMLPSVVPEGTPNYNDPAWDPIFALGAATGTPFTVHVSSGDEPVRAMRGPGGALYNYATKVNYAVNVISLLVGGGVLDRNPKAKVVFAEYGAGWLMGLAERLDEVYFGHAPMVQPKLQRLPSQIVKDQIVCSFQNDIGALRTIPRMGAQTMIFATDYPHSEGTFPYSRELVDRMFDSVPELSREDREAVLGMNAARLFKIDVAKARALAA